MRVEFGTALGLATPLLAMTVPLLVVDPWTAVAPGDPSFVVVIAVGVAAVGAVVGALGRRRKADALHRHGDRTALRLWCGALVVLWLPFLVLDLGHSLVALLIGVVPAGAFAAHGIAQWRKQLLPCAIVLGGAAVVATMMPSLLELSWRAETAIYTSGVVVAGIGVALAVAGATRPARARLLGAAVGVAAVWVHLVWRSDNGCTGVSDLYRGTVDATTLCFFGLAPPIIGRALSPRRRAPGASRVAVGPPGGSPVPGGRLVR